MERLTRRMCGGWGLIEGCEINTPGGMRRIVERLAAYENTGLAPEEIADFQENYRIILSLFADYKAAEVQGRLAILPCKVGDIVYDIQDGTPYATRVLSFSYFGDHWACRTVSSYPDLEEFGKRIFLTCDAAEAALKEQGE